MVYICSYMKRFERILLAIALSGIMLSAGDICMAKDSAVSSSESLSSNATATRMIKTVGRKMVSALEAYIKEHGKDDAMSGLKWEFMLLDSDEVNAFCSPDGKIAFLEGILKYADTPDYIAVVMGHEMAHALAKHVHTQPFAYVVDVGVRKKVRPCAVRNRRAVREKLLCRHFVLMRRTDSVRATYVVQNNAKVMVEYNAPDVRRKTFAFLRIGIKGVLTQFDFLDNAYL